MIDCDSYSIVRKHLELANGSKISIQASNTHYCTPRGWRPPYTEVEVWADKGLAEYLDAVTGEGWYKDAFEEEPFTNISVKHVNDYIETVGGVK